MGSINKLHNMLTEKEISCCELTQEYLKAIDRDNIKLGAYILPTADEALSAACEADKKFAQGSADLLCGIPMALKDNISTKGIATTCCSRILEGYKPIYDATAWSRLKSSGAVLLGKTNMDEFAMGSTCETSCYGVTRNPHNLNCVPGGSSGGSAAAVAANLAVYSLGTDTGGSVRQPACFCGVTGLKPTYGAVSRYGMIAFASCLDQIGLFAQSVEDVSAVFDTIGGFDPLDCTSKRDYAPHTLRGLEKDIKGSRIGIIRQMTKNLSPDVERSLDNAIRIYESLGASIVYFDMPVIKYAQSVYYILACADASSNLGRFDGVRFGRKTDVPCETVKEMMMRTRSEGFGDEVKRRMLFGTYVLSEQGFENYYKKARTLRSMIAEDFERLLSDCDVIFAPATAGTAFPLKSTVENDPMESYKADVCTLPVNIAGLPAVTLPCGYSSEGMPMGMQIIGNRFCEDKVLNFAHKFQQATDFAKTADWGVSL